MNSEICSRQECEFLRLQSKQRFELVKPTWIECGRWALPHKIKWLTSKDDGARNNQHIVDSTHIIALRSYVAGFLEGNTSATRPWAKVRHADPDLNNSPANKEWLELLTKRVMNVLSNSNFYHAAGAFYYDFGVFNTGAYYIDEMYDGRLHFHNLTPGAYYCLNNSEGVADILVREFSLTVKALIDTYGQKKDGKWDWSNFTPRVRELYERGIYTQMIDVVHVVKPNKHFNNNLPHGLLNRQWISLTYELGGSSGQYYEDGQEFTVSATPDMDKLFLKVSASKRKPFIVGRSDSDNNFEYGQKGPTLDALGLIKSLNKKAIGKDIALDQMLKPAVQGPASLRKSYVTTAPNAYIPLDATSMAQGGLKRVFEINPAVATLIQDVSDLRNQVEKLYYADYLLYLSQNPKTRTARETDAVVNEQQIIIGPNLQSLNWTHNVPVMDLAIDYVIDTDPYLPPPPQDLQGQFLRTEFISVFAQAQKAADLPSIDRYVDRMLNVASLNPAAFDKVNLDKLGDLYEDRLYLPVGLNNPQSKVDAMREQQAKMQERQHAITEAIPALAGASKDMSAVNKK